MLTKIGARLRRWRRRFSRAEWTANRLHLPRNPEGSHTPGLLLIQIDGLGRKHLENAIAAGRMPHCARLLRREHATLHTFYSGQPATTPAVQAELHYGVKTAVPAFSYLDPRADDIGMMMYPDWAKRIEADLARNHEGLLKDGSSWSNIYTGGATQRESHFCGASLSFADIWNSGKIRHLLVLLIIHFPSVLRLLALLPLEFVLSIADAFRGILKGQSIRRELLFIFARVFVCVGLRELITLGAKVDLARGLPIIHVNFLGYDEQSHRRGPDSRFAHWTLRGIDRAVRLLTIAARRSEGRDYEVWIFSDHGQIRTKPFSRVVDGGLEGLLRRNWPGLSEQQRQTESHPRNQDRVSHALHPSWKNRADRSHLTTFERTEFAVACLGPVGHLYFKRPLDEPARRKLIQDLLDGGVPGVLYRRTGDDTVVWATSERTAELPRDESLLKVPDEMKPLVAEDLVGLARQPYSGNLICLGWHPDGRSYSFTEENGAHCGPSPDETQGFLLMPPGSTHVELGPVVRPRELRQAALTHLGRVSRPQHRRTTKRHARRIRVVSYNVHYCRGTDGRFAPDRVARILRSLDPDIVALQELDVGRPRSRGDDQLAYLAKELGLYGQFCPSIINGEEKYGHGVLSTRPLHFVAQERLPTGGVPVIEPRDALHTATHFGDRSIHLISTHLGLARPERAAQIDRLLQSDFLDGITPDQPSLFMGDLNLTPGGSLYRRLVAKWSGVNGHPEFRNVQAHAPNHVAVKTFPSFLPIRALDHIFVTPHFSILSVDAPSDFLTRRASDHLPLVADLELND